VAIWLGHGQSVNRLRPGHSLHFAPVYTDSAKSGYRGERHNLYRAELFQSTIHNPQPTTHNRELVLSAVINMMTAQHFASSYWRLNLASIGKLATV
jgi:hypothetical protein